jgi:hypothetical protein
MAVLVNGLCFYTLPWTLPHCFKNPLFRLDPRLPRFSVFIDVRLGNCQRNCQFARSADVASTRLSVLVLGLNLCFNHGEFCDVLETHRKTLRSRSSLAQAVFFMAG